MINTKGGSTKAEKYSADTVTSLYKISPSQLPCLKAVTGNLTDSIPGIDGVGENATQDILIQCGTIGQIYEQLSNPNNNLSPTICEKLLSHAFPMKNTLLQLLIKI